MGSIKGNFSDETPLRDLMDQLPSLISYLEPGYTYRFVNSAYEDWFGHKRAEIVGKRVSDVLGPEAFQKVEPYLIRAFEGEAVNFQNLVLDQTGQERYVDVSYAPVVHEEKVLGIYALVHDVTQLKRVAQDLIATNSTLQALIQASPLAVMVLSLDGTVGLWNPAAEKIFGWTELEVLGKFLPAIPESKREEFKENLVTIGAGKRISGLETIRQSKTGTFIASLWAAPFKTADGQIQCLSIIEDITQRKAAEQALRDSVNLRDEFLSIASHELRTPLTSLYLQLQLLELENARSTDPEKLQKENVSKLSIAREQAKRLGELINTLLDITLFSNGNLLIEPNTFDLASTVREVIARFETELKNSTCQISTHLVYKLDVHLDKLRIEQALTNLVSNALKYGKRKPIHVELTHDYNCIQLSVKDSGIGISVQDQSRIFERFERAVSHQKISGMGLGLYVTRQIVEAHGGTVSVQSEFGEGATFTLTLPFRVQSGNLVEGIDKTLASRCAHR